MRKITIKQREKLGKIWSGKSRINADSVQKFLEIPEVAITFEALLDRIGLTDDKLMSRMLEVINRKATRTVNARGQICTNITSIDANVINAIRMVWQTRGKFIEKHKHEFGPLGSIPDKDLDNIIAEGAKLLSPNLNPLKSKEGGDSRDATS